MAIAPYHLVAASQSARTHSSPPAAHTQTSMTCAFQYPAPGSHQSRYSRYSRIITHNHSFSIYRLKVSTHTWIWNHAEAKRDSKSLPRHFSPGCNTCASRQLRIGMAYEECIVYPYQSHKTIPKNRIIFTFFMLQILK